MPTQVIEFPYKRHPSRDDAISRPYAEVWLSVKGAIHPFDFLIDSGADRTIINHSLGILLGFERGDHPQEKHVKGMGGYTVGFLKPLTLTIGDRSFSTDVFWVQSDEVPLLLGQRGVFDHFKITFMRREQKVVFEWLGI